MAYSVNQRSPVLVSYLAFIMEVYILKTRTYINTIQILYCECRFINNVDVTLWIVAIAKCQFSGSLTRQMVLSRFHSNVTCHPSSSHHFH